MVPDNVLEIGSSIDLSNGEFQRSRFWNLDSDPTTHALGLVYFDTNEVVKRVKYCVDASAGTYVHVPRFDENAGGETIANLVTFSRAGAPFAVNNSTMVENLNVEYHADESGTGRVAFLGHQEPWTIPVRDAGGRIYVGDPVDPNQATNVRWVEQRIQGIISKKASCVAAATGNIDLSDPPASFDGVALENDKRYLIPFQTNKVQNGIYIYNGSGNPMTRATDLDEDDEVDVGLAVFVDKGTEYANKTFQLLDADPDDPIEIGVSELTFTTVSGAETITVSSGLGQDGDTLYVKLGSAGSPSGSEYTAGGIVYAASTSTLNHAQLTGIIRGNGSSAPSATALGTANQLFGMHASNGAPEFKTLNGTSNQVLISHGSNSITLGTPQNIHTGASPAFSGLTLSGLTANRLVRAASGGVLGNSAIRDDGTNVGIGVTPTAILDISVGVDQRIKFVSAGGEARISTSNDAASTNTPFRIQASVLRVFGNAGVTELMTVADAGFTLRTAQTINPGTTQADALVFDMAALTSAGQRDSHILRFTGQAWDTAARQVDWRMFVDVTSNAGASDFLIQSRIGAAGYQTRLKISDSGVLTAGGIQQARVRKGTVVGDGTTNPLELEHDLDDDTITVTLIDDDTNKVWGVSWKLKPGDEENTVQIFPNDPLANGKTYRWQVVA